MYCIFLIQTKYNNMTGTVRTLRNIIRKWAAREQFHDNFHWSIHIKFIIIHR